MTTPSMDSTLALFADLDAAISRRLHRADQAVAVCEAPDRFTDLTLAERVESANTQAERYCRRAEDAARQLDSLIKSGKLDDADRLVRGSALSAVEAAAREAASASDAAVELQRHANEASEALSEARALVALGPAVKVEAAAAWVAEATARLTALEARVDRAMAAARDAGQAALNAAANSIQANVALEQAKSNVNLVKVSSQIKRWVNAQGNQNNHIGPHFPEAF